jgi:hypothetical protein
MKIDEVLSKGKSKSRKEIKMLNPERMPPKPPELSVYVNGEWLLDGQAKISVMDHGLLYGDGCFDAWMGMNGFIYELDKHLDRLYRSVFSLQLDLRMSKGETRLRPEAFGLRFCPSVVCLAIAWNPRSRASTISTSSWAS